MYSRHDETIDTVFEWIIFEYLNSSTLIWKVRQLTLFSLSLDSY